MQTYGNHILFNQDEGMMIVNGQKNKYNQKQNNNFRLYFNLFKSIKYKSLVSSMGILLGKDFHYDLIRPGISIYGGHYNNKLKKKINF